MKKSVIAAALALLSAASHANLLTNGSFEDVTGLVFTPDGYVYTASPAGWNMSFLSGGALHAAVLFNNSYVGGPAGHGNIGLQLEWHRDTISQTFATVAGQQYQVSLLATSYNATPTSLGVSLNGITIASGSGYVHGTWTPLVANFVGNGSNMTLALANTGTVPPAFGQYLQIDNVSVTAVPEPSAYAMALAGLGLLAIAAHRRRMFKA